MSNLRISIIGSVKGDGLNLRTYGKEKVCCFVNSKFHANLNRLFIGKGSEEEKIRQIDKWWNAYKEQKK